MYKTRLISPMREIDPFLPVSGNVTLRAHWTLWGCTDAGEDGDCLTPLQHVGVSGSVADVDIQEPVDVVSNEVELAIKPLPDPGPMSLSFVVTALPNGESAPRPANAIPPAEDKDCPAGAMSAECVTFHYTIQNRSSYAVRLGTYSCSGDSITPEYRVAGGTWKPLEGRMWVCNSNIFYLRGIPAGGSMEGYFTLRHLTPAWNTDPLRGAGVYGFRFTLHPLGCAASPDASFCLVPLTQQPMVVSPEVVVKASAAVG